MTTSPASEAAAVRPISSAEHLAYLRSLPSASFLQTPAWGRVKTEWTPRSVGFFAGPVMVGAGLVLLRQIPKLRRFLAYLPEGPTLDWSRPDLPQLLDALAALLKTDGAFAIRIGPPVVSRRWEAATVKQAIPDPTTHRLSEVAADEHSDLGARVVSVLRRQGWRELPATDGFRAGQPRYNFWLPLKGRDEDNLLAGMNQLWRRNIKKAAKAGVQITVGGREDLPAFHRMYVQTAARDSFTPRPLAYFETMYDALTAEDPDRLRLYLAQHDGDLVAATTLVWVGDHAWYSYGASTTANREVRGSNAIQWQMMRDSRAAGATVYDMRGITDTVDESDEHIGLLQFKLGTGGEAVEYVGEWDLALSPVLYRAFNLYLRRR